MNRVLLKKLWRDLYARKGSFLSLVMILTIGLGIYVGMGSVWYDLDGARARYYRQQRLADFWIDMKRMPEGQLYRAATVPNVQAVRGRVHVGALLDVDGPDELFSGTVISMPAQRRPVLNDVLLRSGMWFSSPDAEEAILNDSFAEANGIQTGDRIKVLLMDQEHEVLVVGTAMSPEFVYLLPPGGALAPDPARFGVVYMPERFLQDAADLRGAYNEIIGRVHNDDKTEVDNALALIGDRLDAYGVVNSTPKEHQASYRFLADELRGLRVMAFLVPGLFITVAAMILNVLLSRVIAQQRVIVGTLRALGYTRGQIMTHFVGFGLSVGVLGGLFGLALGQWMQGGMVRLYKQFFALPNLEQHFYPGVNISAWLAVLVFALLGTMLAVRKAARLEPAEAMRPPPPEKGGRMPLEHIGFIWQLLSFRWKMISRAIYRNPLRSTAGILATAISTALICSTIAMQDSIDFMMEFQFREVAHQDVTISFRDPEGFRALREVQDFPGVSSVEPQLGIACDFQHGPHRRRSGITALPQNPRLYTPLDSNKNSIPIPDRGIILSEALAKILHAEVGSVLNVRPLIGERKQVEAPVVAVVPTYMGLDAYAGIDYISGLIGEDLVVNTVQTRFYGGAPRQPFNREVRQLRTVIGTDDRERAFRQLDETFGETNQIMVSITILFAGLIAFGSVFNAALVSLSEREREVGTFRVLGYTPLQITAIFAGETFVLNVIGIGLGMVFGIGLVHLFSLAYSSELFRLPVVLDPSAFLVSGLLMISFTSFSQLIVYRMIRRFPWLTVLKVKE